MLSVRVRATPVPSVIMLRSHNDGSGKSFTDRNCHGFRQKPSFCFLKNERWHKICGFKGIEWAWGIWKNADMITAAKDEAWNGKKFFLQSREYWHVPHGSLRRSLEWTCKCVMIPRKARSEATGHRQRTVIYLTILPWISGSLSFLLSALCCPPAQRLIPPALRPAKIK